MVSCALFGGCKAAISHLSVTSRASGTVLASRRGFVHWGGAERSRLSAYWSFFYPVVVLQLKEVFDE